MAIIADFKPLDLKDAYIKILSVWGSVAEGWNCWVGVSNSKSDDIITKFHFNVPYGEFSPFNELYLGIKHLDFLVFKGDHFESESIPKNYELDLVISDTLKEGPLVNNIETKKELTGASSVEPPTGKIRTRKTKKV